MVQIVLVDVPSETAVVGADVIVEVVEVAEQGPPGPPGGAENVAEIVPSPILSFENALV